MVSPPCDGTLLPGSGKAGTETFFVNPRSILGIGWLSRSVRRRRKPRLPRILGATAQVDNEQRWLPKFAPLLALAIPVPLAMGEAGDGNPCTGPSTGGSRARTPRSIESTTQCERPSSWRTSSPSCTGSIRVLGVARPSREGARRAVRKGRPASGSMAHRTEATIPVFAPVRGAPWNRSSTREKTASSLEESDGRTRVVTISLP